MPRTQPPPLPRQPKVYSLEKKPMSLRILDWSIVLAFAAIGFTLLTGKGEDLALLVGGLLLFGVGAGVAVSLLLLPIMVVAWLFKNLD